MGEVAGWSPPSDRSAVARVAHDLVLAAVQRDTPAGTSVVIEGAPGIGKSFLAREILGSAAAGTATVLRVAGEQGRRNDPFTIAGPILGRAPGAGDPGDAAFDRVDELCASGPVVLWADDAHQLDAASLTLLRRLVWASRSLPLAVLVTTRPSPSRESLATLAGQAQVHLSLPPMNRMMVERLVFDRTGRWPGPRLRRVLGLAAGNPLFVAELLAAYEQAGALDAAGRDALEARFELDLQATGLNEVIRAQFRQLDEPARDALAAMAVWGADIGLDDLASLLPGAAPLDEPIERAISSGLARREPAGTVGFGHDLFREVAYADLAEPRRRDLHRHAAQRLAAGGYSPALVADHLLRATAGPDPALVSALHEAVAATRGYAPEVTADLLDDVAASGTPGLSEPLLLDHVQALFLRGRDQAAETLIRQHISAVTDPAVATQLQVFLIRSLMNRAETAAARAAIDHTLAIAGLPAAAARLLEATRSWLLVMAGQGLPAAELDEMRARFIAAGDQDAQASLLSTIACTAYLAGQPGPARELMRSRETLLSGTDSFRTRSSSLFLPAVIELVSSGPRAAKAAIDQARQLSAERNAEWVEPFLGVTAGAIAFSAGDWDDAVAELDSALERAEETGTGWVSLPIGLRSYIDAHRGHTVQARDRLEAFRHRGLPLQFGHDRPGLAELAVLEAEGAASAAATLARTLWSAARDHPGRWPTDLAPDVTRITMTAMDRRLAGQIGDEVTALCSPEAARLVHGMLAADPDAIAAASGDFAAAGLLAAEALAREELACAAAAAGDRGRALAALDAALAGYQRMGAVCDRDRTLGRMRALGIRRGPREAHRDASFGWASLTTTEVRIADLVRDGLTNREIGTRLFVSPVRCRRTSHTSCRRPACAPGSRSPGFPGLRSAGRRMSRRASRPKLAGMKPVMLVLSFLPLIAFSLLARLLPPGDIGVAGLIAAVLALIAMVATRPVWPPKILSACSLLLFAVLAVLGFSLGHGSDRWLATWGGAGVGLVVGLVILVLIPVMPFTEQFARQSTPQAYWSSPTFKQINRVLSVSWGAAIVALGVSRVAAAAVAEHVTSHRVPELILSAVIPVVIILCMLRFSKSYPDRVAHQDAHPAG